MQVTGVSNIIIVPRILFSYDEESPRVCKKGVGLVLLKRNNQKGTAIHPPLDAV